VNKVSDYLKEGQEVKVKLIEIDRQGRVRLSMKEVNAPSAEAPVAVANDDSAETAKDPE
jgi:polyribonucleotide nucleotidyltransferase